MSLSEGSERKRREDEMRQAGRLPPGQSLTEKWPVLHYGSVPTIDLASWNLRIFGEVESPTTFRFDELRALPHITLSNDIHCVTGWSKFDCRWDGISVRDLIARVRPTPLARYVMVHAEHGFSSNLPLADLLDESVLLAFGMNGEPLAPEHGWPLRLVAPKLYFWKSVKWVRAFELMQHDAPGFWERNGYHMRGNPWNSERYSDE
jgi:DMSO/TMAO reductase YedYZ molybdopterin-dependent catalytic subunit